ncbi:GyrI-like domain-containing protein [Pararhodobacter aggregans]|uniref:GyrI-like domain-containing protein n=1 Tax=Pararhodobacter aggregans TaxID=404875 RepID=UPI003A93CAE7
MTDPLLTGKPGRIDRVTVPPMVFFAIEGQGAPGGAEHQPAVEALYGLAYGARFAGKAQGHDEKVGPLEGQWWSEDYAVFQPGGDRKAWRWRMMIRSPGWLDQAGFEDLRRAAIAKKGAGVFARVTLWPFDEGLCLQALHLGSYADEGPLIARIHDQAAAEGLALTGQHHEIYLSDPRRVAPEKLKTILRQPVRAHD